MRRIVVASTLALASPLVFAFVTSCSDFEHDLHPGSPAPHDDVVLQPIPLDDRALGLNEQNAIFSCREREEGGEISVCFEVSLDVLGNDTESVRLARKHCDTHDWVSGEGCPAGGARQVCRGAALEDAFVYDKYAYSMAIPLLRECLAHGGSL